MSRTHFVWDMASDQLLMEIRPDAVTVFTNEPTSNPELRQSVLLPRQDERESNANIACHVGSDCIQRDSASSLGAFFYYDPASAAISSFSYFRPLKRKVTLGYVQATTGAKACTEGDLIETILCLLEHPPDGEMHLWWHIWDVVSQHPWVHQMQRKEARRVVRVYWQQQQWIEEMVQHSNYRLGLDLRRRPTLGLPKDQIENRFVPFLRRTIHHHFVAWLRHCLTVQERFVAVVDEDFEYPRDTVDDEELMRLNAAIQRLSVREQRVLLLRLQRVNREEISQRLGLSKWQIDGAISRGKKRLRRELKPTDNVALAIEEIELELKVSTVF